MTTPKSTTVSPAVRRNLNNARAFGWTSRQAATPDLGDKVAADKVAGCRFCAVNVGHPCALHESDAQFEARMSARATR